MRHRGFKCEAGEMSDWEAPVELVDDTTDEWFDSGARHCEDCGAAFWLLDQGCDFHRVARGPLCETCLLFRDS
jgi:hypothetical protein